jgi:hypothetical protein
MQTCAFWTSAKEPAVVQCEVITVVFFLKIQVFMECYTVYIGKQWNVAKYWQEVCIKRFKWCVVNYLPVDTT